MSQKQVSDKLLLHVFQKYSQNAIFDQNSLIFAAELLDIDLIPNAQLTNYDKKMICKETINLLKLKIKESGSYQEKSENDRLSWKEFKDFWFESTLIKQIVAYEQNLTQDITESQEGRNSLSLSSSISSIEYRKEMEESESGFVNTQKNDKNLTIDHTPQAFRKSTNSFAMNSHIDTFNIFKPFHKSEVQSPDISVADAFSSQGQQDIQTTIEIQKRWEEYDLVNEDILSMRAQKEVESRKEEFFADMGLNSLQIRAYEIQLSKSMYKDQKNYSEQGCRLWQTCCNHQNKEKCVIL